MMVMGCRGRPMSLFLFPTGSLRTLSVSNHLVERKEKTYSRRDVSKVSRASICSGSLESIPTVNSCHRSRYSSH